MCVFFFFGESTAEHAWAKGLHFVYIRFPFPSSQQNLRIPTSQKHTLPTDTRVVGVASQGPAKNEADVPNDRWWHANPAVCNRLRHFGFAYSRRFAYFDNSKAFARLSYIYQELT